MAKGQNKPQKQQKKKGGANKAAPVEPVVDNKNAKKKK
jgi:hypothetical protein